jgi:hypothetical protein
MTGKVAPPASPTIVEVQVVVNRIDDVDLVNGMCKVKLEISMNWKDPRVKTEEDVADCWRPELNVFNRDPDAEVFRSDVCLINGICGQDITFTGGVTFSPGRGIAEFPFDAVDLDIIIDGCDPYLHHELLDLRIVPVESIHSEGIKRAANHTPLALKFSDQFRPEDMAEWNVVEVGYKEFCTSWTRTYKRLCVRLRMERSSVYYMTKIVFVEVLINFLSVAAFSIDIADGGGADRLSFLATMFLATTAFLFVMSAEIPKSGYLNHLDYLMVGSFLMQFAASLVTAAQLVLFRNDMYVDKFWIADVVLATFIGFATIFPLAFYWVPKAVYGKGSKTKDELTLKCKKKSEEYGVSLGIHKWPSQYSANAPTDFI